MDTLNRLLSRIATSIVNSSPWINVAPIREELFSVERLEAHARSLAVAQTIDPRLSRGKSLSYRLADNGAVLLRAYKTILLAVADESATTPAADWLIDNYHLVETQLRLVGTDLPAGYYRELPKLLTGPFAGYPRVFGLTWAFVAHTDSSFDSDVLIRYINAYQEVQPLTIGELWAACITLQFVLIENLRRVSEQIIVGRSERRDADRAADRLLGVGGKAPEPATAVFGRRRHRPITHDFAVQLVHRLRDQDPKFTPALTWLDARLAKQHLTADLVVREVHRSQGAANVTVRNIMTSLRLISEVDWKELFERVSLVDESLASGSRFREMDFATRTLYRTSIERLARNSTHSEIEVARLVLIEAARARPDIATLEQLRLADPGYFLIGEGRRSFERSIGFQLLFDWPSKLTARTHFDVYASGIVFVSAILAASILMLLAHYSVSAGNLIVLALLGIVPASDVGVAIVNRFMTWCFRPHSLPGLELQAGVPESLRTMVVIPSLLTSSASIAELVERLEIHHLASPEGEIYFALLSDWTDADAEHMVGDADLLICARDSIAALNVKYAPALSGPRFFLLHRRRVWNPGENSWIGWERKRGKLHELNRLLRGAANTTFVGAPVLPNGVQYVVTLDADTRLPRDSVRRLIGKMAHPLNRPKLNLDSRIVVEGYAILQPRVTPSLPNGGGGSVFQRIFSSSAGLDPYASAISDGYQDIFGEGSYAGKGIYEVDAFEAAINGRAPDSSMLSHDLFEGTFARAGFVSDIEVVEEFPSRYDVSASRRHRWARGDWQLLPWILGLNRGQETPELNTYRLPTIGRWKMLDNLRRTLSAPTCVLALLFGWTLAEPAAIIWTTFVLGTLALPALIPMMSSVATIQRGISLRNHMRALGGDLVLASTLFGLEVTFLADQATLMSDAILRTLWRIFFSRKHLLQWTPAAQAEASGRLDLIGFAGRMSGSLIIAGIAIVSASAFGHGAWPLAASIAFFWLAAPAVARFVSLSPDQDRVAALTADERIALRSIARSTWRYFETFVTAADNWLPPDNFQEDPSPVIAHRTSPTNIGLYLLSIVSARDFGWIGAGQAIDRLEATLGAMLRMPRFRGHFYNWSDTRDLGVLEPKYVSTVDSGNLVGHLLAVVNASREWRQTQPSNAARLDGIADMIGLAAQGALYLRVGRVTQTVTPSQLDASLRTMSASIATPAKSDEAFAAQLAGLADEAGNLLDIAKTISLERRDGSAADVLYWAQAIGSGLANHLSDIAVSDNESARRNERLTCLEDAFRSIALSTEFGFLFDPSRQLLSIGFLVAETALDSNCYDLLASEARLASFVAIAKGDIPARHWFRLGRAATPVGRGAALISWSGSMFEYLMPPLVMRAPTGSLLDRTDRLIVRSQLEYGARRGVPWGVSESAYNARDLDLNYQYSNFGLPSLGLKRGLGEDCVVAPYATGLASMIEPSAAAANWSRLTQIGARGRYGFFEAIDYTPTRIPEGETLALVRAYMAHHQGMTIVAIGNALFDGAMRTRFHAEPIIQATELLLQERVPREVATTAAWAAEIKSTARMSDETPAGGRKIPSPHLSAPATQLLSNGRYGVMMTAAGSGYSRWGDMAVTRWREDSTRDHCGSYIYLRDIRSGVSWSAGFQPTGAEPDEYVIRFAEDRAEISRRDGTLRTTLEVLVSAEDDAEVRRITISNGGSRVREIEVTSYIELALGPQSADVAHPAFAKLFVETEYLPGLGALLATRRKRSPEDPGIWAAHLSVANGDAMGPPEFETDRARFLGRGHGLSAPLAMLGARSLSNSVGPVLDPIFAIRRRVRVAPGATVHIAFWTMAAPSRAEILDCVDKHRDQAAYERATTLAWTQGQVQLHHLSIKPGDAGLFQRLAGHVIFAGRALRPASDILRLGSGPQSGLWPLGISGDLPIVLVRIADSDSLPFIHKILQAHEYWRMKQLAVDLVILNERRSSYVQDLQIGIETLVRASQSRPSMGVERQPGRVFAFRSDLVSAGARALLISTARVVLAAQHGSLADQLDRAADASPPIRMFAKPLRPLPRAAALSLPKDLEFFNGLGGFGSGGKEYVTLLGPGQSTPAPWINVIANERFGFQISTEGSGYTWSSNSRENQLTPWSNDGVSDPVGEAFYIRDDESGELWSPTALPIRDPQGTYIAHHGRGYSRFKYVNQGVESDLRQYVPVEGSIKISRLRLTNESQHTRLLSVTAYVEWVLGTSRSATAAFIETEVDSETGAIFAHNPFNIPFGSRMAFVDMAGAQTDLTGDRREFIGRNGSLSNPAGLAGGSALSNKVGAGFDPCGAMRTTVRLSPGATSELVIFLGQSASRVDARAVLKRFRNADLDALEAEVSNLWDGVLGAIEVRTPDRAMDIMLNGWLLYQTLACRVWARSAFYQASGAYGFRDQLQDGMALAAARPDLTREHILRAASRQFVEGDVQHWWLPHSGEGVRTRISDDRSWLAYTVAQYVETSGDLGILDEAAAFLEGPTLRDDRTDDFSLPNVSQTRASLFEHCALALDKSLAVGAHGLPLMGAGDWNDGMNRVGEKGHGESVWLGWFLHATLTAFAPLAEARGQTDRATAWIAHAEAMRDALERHAWDGDWYVRGFFDDGSPLGAASSDECRIDSIAQSWAVISGAASTERAERAMASLDRELMRRDEGLALLFTPPFDKSLRDPGYIKGYPPGVRENGGQYTHAATWSIIALAKLGDGDKAAALFAMLNPIHHSQTRADCYRYKVEPYVVSADVYSCEPHIGRGGWTWYTGSAGWLQRAGVETVLGLRLSGGGLLIDPCVPKNWKDFDANVKYRSSRYKIRVENPDGVNRGVVAAHVDGVEIAVRPVCAPLIDDGAEHNIHVRLG